MRTGAAGLFRNELLELTPERCQPGRASRTDAQGPPPVRGGRTDLSASAPSQLTPCLCCIRRAHPCSPATRSASCKPYVRRCAAAKTSPKCASACSLLQRQRSGGVANTTPALTRWLRSPLTQPLCAPTTSATLSGRQSSFPIWTHTHTCCCAPPPTRAHGVSNATAVILRQCWLD